MRLRFIYFSTSVHFHQPILALCRVGYRMTGYDGLDSPKLGSSPKYSEETVTCDSDGKPGHEPDYIKGELREL